MSDSVRSVIEDALAYNLTKINGSAPYTHVITAAQILRRPHADMTGKEAILMYPGPEDVLTDRDQFGSGLWRKRLTMALKWYYKDTSTDGSGRFSRLADLERMIGLNNDLRTAAGISTVDLTLLVGNKWGGMEDGQSDTWIAALITMDYDQAISNPEEPG